MVDRFSGFTSFLCIKTAKNFTQNISNIIKLTISCPDNTDCQKVNFIIKKIVLNFTCAYQILLLYALKNYLFCPFSKKNLKKKRQIIISVIPVRDWAIVMDKRSGMKAANMEVIFWSFFFVFLEKALCQKMEKFIFFELQRVFTYKRKIEF